ncbi:MAG: hypothetical protein SPK62_08305 [Gemmiger sp.]|nr:hypothetical protein [Gemmiger sp.]MDY5783895.1 hypothetical protein [Gemmiger sp.]
MKQTWVTPCVNIQNFEANEYVAACWNVACQNNTTYYNRNSNAPDSSKWSGKEGPYDSVFSHEGTCTDSSNNYFRVDADGTVTFIEETTADQGSLKGGYDGYTDVNNNGVLDGGDYVYWYTDNGTRRWNHWGVAQTADAAHPNRS